MDHSTDSNAAPKPEWALTRRELERRALADAGLVPRRFPWPWVLGIVAVAGVGFVVVPQLRPSEAAIPPVAEAAAPTVMRLLDVDVTALQPRAVSETLKATGSLAPRRTIQLTSQASGTVQDVKVRLGDVVSAGDVLVQIDVESLEIQLRQQKSIAEATRAQLVQSRTQLERTARLLERGLVASSVLDAEQAGVDGLDANLKALEAQVASAEIGLRNATVTAPFDGVVAARSIEPGQVVSPGTALMQVVDLSVMEMTANVPVSSSPLLATGQAVILSIEGLPGREFTGQVAGISPVAAEGTRTVPVLVTLSNEDGLLRGGMYASGTIVTDESENALAVPASAIKADDAGEYVLEVSEGSLVRQPVERLRTWDNGETVQLAAGLEPGDIFVSGNLPELVPGTPVTLVGN